MDESFSRLFSSSKNIVLGKEKHLQWAMLAILCRGNLLIEDFPGVGKTTLVYLISKLLGRKLTRIQFTNDLLPSDILGSIVFDKDKNDFYFRRGPIFGEMILADELNRATPKTQSALLQSMEERRVSIEGRDYDLSENHCLIATQNPYDHVGTFHLPESQVDRFFMAMSLGLPTREHEKTIIQTVDVRQLIDDVKSIFDQDMQRAFFQKLSSVTTAEPLLQYALNLMDYLRNIENKGHISPRSGRDLVWAAKGNALIEGRIFVIPEDIKSVAPAVFCHRLGLYKGVKQGLSLIEKALQEVAVP